MEFQSFANDLQPLLEVVVEHSHLHSRWLNTLSYWENCGARKLAACEHPTKVKEEMLKHAAEEFRHAFYLKQQIHKLAVPFIPNYEVTSLLGGWEAYHYLLQLDLEISRFLKQGSRINRADLKALAYLVVTYAIECRAEEVYAVYQWVLKQKDSPVRVQSILLEEREHLAEIKEELFLWPDHHQFCHGACRLEEKLCEKWLRNLKQQLTKNGILTV